MWVCKLKERARKKARKRKKRKEKKRKRIKGKVEGMWLWTREQLSGLFARVRSYWSEDWMQNLGNIEVVVLVSAKATQDVKMALGAAKRTIRFHTLLLVRRLDAESR
jgi:bisphosphoglycerate-dependent phosphoglycerate mutase